MAPPDWVYEKRISPEERKKLARERMGRILKKQAEDAQQEQSQQALSFISPEIHSPSTPILAVSLQRLQLNTTESAQEKRKRDDAVSDDSLELHEQARRTSIPDTRPGIASPSADSNDHSDGYQVQPLPKRLQPLWYSKIPHNKLGQRGAKGQKEGNRNIDAKLEQIKDLIKQCKKGTTTHLFDRIRDELHDLVFLQVSELALRRKRMLHNDSGLPQLFDEDESDIPFPWDIKADARELYNRWALRDFSIELLRGITKRPSTAGTSGNRSTDRIDPKFPGKIKANFYGEGSLVNGQWWPTQLCTVRDGAHGSSQGGIYATKGKPAFSIVLSGGNHYQDRDEGEEIWYSGTDGKDGKPSENTQSLMYNITACEVVRVIRSHNLSASTSMYRPPRGFRYDGLYEVLGYQIIDQTKIACLFQLRRKSHQDPIRFSGKEMRPTAAEIMEYDKLKSEIEASERI